MFLLPETAGAQGLCVFGALANTRRIELHQALGVGLAFQIPVSQAVYLNLSAASVQRQREFFGTTGGFFLPPDPENQPEPVRANASLRSIEVSLIRRVAQFLPVCHVFLGGGVSMDHVDGREEGLETRHTRSYADAHKFGVFVRVDLESLKMKALPLSVLISIQCKHLSQSYESITDVPDPFGNPFGLITLRVGVTLHLWGPGL